MTQPKVSGPPRHRPVETCADCRQPWPCGGEKARVEQILTRAEPVAVALEAGQIKIPLAGLEASHG